MLTADVLKKAVSLSTGLVAFPMPLVELQGRNGLNFSLQALYQGAVEFSATTWNLEAPTGCLGLGWMLGGEMIFADYRQTGLSSAASYFYSGDGVADRLLATGRTGTVTSFVLASRRFWQIRYDSAAELWTLIKEDGRVHTFGGGVTRGPSGANTSTGNSIEWGVRWGAWTGGSVLTQNQSQYALTWRLNKVSDTWGNSILYTYTAFSDDNIAVGNGGLPYTRATYLDTVTDTFGRKVKFTYGAKLSTGSQQEYQPAHTGASPNAWQDRYETRFLQSIDVTDAGGSAVMGVDFSFEVKGAGSLAKRYLTQARRRDSRGGTLAPVSFTYRNGEGATPAGALDAVKLPSGATFAFTYAEQTQGQSSRTISLKKTERVSPRVWFDVDYAVVTWKDNHYPTYRPYIYQWTGRWEETDLSEEGVADQYDNLRVLTESNLCGIFRPQYTYNGNKVKPSLYCLHKNPASPGAWVSSNRRLDALNLDEQVDVASGDGFLAALGKSSGKLYRITWNGSAWSEEAPLQLPTVSGGTTLYALCAKNNYLAALYRSNSDSAELVYLKIWYLDASGTWQAGYDGSLRSTAVYAHEIMAYAGSSFLVLRVYNNKWIGDDYRYQAITWGADFSSPTVTMLVDAGNETVPGIHGGLVGIESKLFRYNGVNWEDRIDLKDSAYRYPGQTGDRFNMSYGFDKAVRRVTQSWGEGVDGYAYDVSEYYPAQRAFKVDRFNGGNLPSVQEQVWSIIGNRNNTVRFPSNYVLVSNKLFYENPDASWSTVTTVPDSVAKKTPESVQLPAFAYLSYQSGADAVVVPLRNGTALAPLTLTGQKIHADNTSGKLLTSLNALVTFTGSFDKPDSITLHAYVKSQLTGTVKSWAVSRLEVDDGLDKTWVSYGYDTSKALAVSTGWAGRFNRTRVMPGSQDGSAAPYGYTDTYSFNGLKSTESLVPFPSDEASTNAASTYPALMGLPYQESASDAQGAQVSLTQNYWWVTTTNQLLAGVSRYPRMRRQDSTIDGLTSTRTFTYSTTTGLLSSTDLTNVNWNGDTEHFATLYKYVTDAYPETTALNLLTPVVQTTEQVVTPQLTFNRSVTVSTWKQWAAGKWAPYKSYRAITNANQFDFTRWSDQTEPPSQDWLKTAVLSAPNGQGLQTEQSDVGGRAVSNLYDSGNRWPVATFTNASIQDGEASYFGLESYESSSGWSVEPGGELYAGDSHTGQNSLRMKPVGGGGRATLCMKGSFSPAARGRSFTVSFWAKTQPGYGSDSGEAFLSITLPSTGENIKVKIPDTQGAWAFVSAPGFAPGRSGVTGPTPVTLELYTQKASKWVLVDDLQFLPVDATSSVNVYDARFGLVTAALENQSSTQRTLFDASQAPIAQIGPTESPTELIALWQIREDPDAQLSLRQFNLASRVRSREAGSYEPFTDDWQSRWEATSANTWSVSGRALRHTGNGAGSCTWKGYGNQLNYGVRVQVLPPAGSPAPAGAVSLAIGNLKVSWRPDTRPGRGFWYLGDNKLTNPFGDGTFLYATDWMFAVVDSRVLFWADGRLIIDSTPQVSSPGVLKLEAATEVSFTGLTTFVEPIIDVVFKDGVGNDRQSQQMTEGLLVAAAQTVYDGLRRPAIRTKASAIQMSSVGPLFVYQSTYLTNGGPTGTIWQTGKAEGDINTYWRGDGGYPFLREQYEASPLGRVIAQGKPGENFSLAGHPTRFAYGISADKRYRTVTLTDPNGIATVMTVDRAGNTVSRKAGPTQAGGTDYALTRYSHSYSSSGQTHQVLLPVSGTTITEQLDFLGRLTLRQAPDSGVTRFIHDAQGRLRYALYAEGEGAGGADKDRILYWTYDALDRVTEAGTVDARWSSLPALPDGGAPPGSPVARKKNTYFGAGTASPGRLQQSATYQPGATSADVALRYTYTSSGNVASVEQLTTVDTVNQTSTVQYVYDNLGNTTRMLYPTRTPLQVNYRYNRRGLVSMIGNESSPAIYAAYTYNADSSILKESLGFNGSNRVNQTYTYNSPGWVTSVSYNSFAGTVLYDTPEAGYQGAVYFDGTIQATASRGLYANAPAGYSYRNAYDPLGQLRFAENTASTNWGIGIGKGIQYDLNGNIQALNRGNLNLAYAYGASSNQLNKVDLNDAVSREKSTVTFSYSKSGQVLSATPGLSSLTYDPFHRLTSTLTVAAPTAAALSFRYSSAGERIYKAHTIGGKTTRTVYVLGLEDEPILHTITQPDGTVAEKAFIRSPNGLIAMITGGKTCYVVRDHQGSTRLVLDQAGAVLAAFDYLPFGQSMRSSGDVALVPYRYTGQEWDGFDAAGQAGLYNYRARLYDPVLGRFYDTDPAHQVASPYVYAGNNPFNFSDPTGMFWKEILGTLAVVGVATAAALLLPETAALGAVLLIWGGYSVGTVIGGSYAMAKGGGPNEVADASLSFGIAGALAAGGAVLGPLAGMSLKSIGIAEFFGVVNAFSMAPSDASAADMGYYLAAGMAISFAAEAIGTAAAARLGGQGVRGMLGTGTLGELVEPARHGGLWNTLTRSTALETAIDASTALRTVQKGVSGVFGGSSTYGLRSAARGDSAGAVVFETLYGGLVYGMGSTLGGMIGGAQGVVGRGHLSLRAIVSDERLNFGLQWVSEKIVKQVAVMSLDQRILISRIATARKVMGWFR